MTRCTPKSRFVRACSLALALTGCVSANYSSSTLTIFYGIH
jgi:hypothetical protein